MPSTFSMQSAIHSWLLSITLCIIFTSIVVIYNLMFSFKSSNVHDLLINSLNSKKPYKKKSGGITPNRNIEFA